MRQLAATFLLLAAAVPALAQAHPSVASAKSVHRGSWWLEHNSVYHEAYISGYKSGWHHAIGHDSPLRAFGATLISDGIDKFYNDFRNRSITVDDAINYVYEQLNGEPNDKLNAELLKLRAEAARGSDDE